MGARVVVLCGGFGGARFVPGVAAAPSATDITVVTNPGDDLRYLGLEVWPDFDSVLYSLAGIFDEEQGWGPTPDTLAVYDALGDEAWFRIGDRDLALSMRRSEWLAEGLSRSETALRCCAALGVDIPVLPTSQQAHRSRVITDAGSHALQEYLVRRRAADTPLAVELAPAASSAIPGVLDALAAADLVVLGPSSPVLSLMPIVAVPGVLDALMCAQRVVGVSPVISATPPVTSPEAGRYRVRERTLGMLGIEHSAAGVARFWNGLVDAWVVDTADDADAATIEREGGRPVLRTELLRGSTDARRDLAEEIVTFGLALPPHSAPRAVTGDVVALVKRALARVVL